MELLICNTEICPPLVPYLLVLMHNFRSFTLLFFLSLLIYKLSSQEKCEELFTGIYNYNVKK